MRISIQEVVKTLVEAVVLVFLVILLVGYAYVWRKGDLDWDKPAPSIPRYAAGTGVHEEAHQDGIEA